MADEKQINPAESIRDEQGRSTVSRQPLNWNDSCVVPPRAVNQRAKQNSRELMANQFDESHDENDKT